MITVHLSEHEGRISANVREITNSRIIISSPSGKILMVGSQLPSVTRSYHSPALTQPERLRLQDPIIVYNIPGGHINKHDLSIEGAAFRELFEETYDHAKIYGYPVVGQLEFVRKYVEKSVAVFCYRTNAEPTIDTYMIKNNEVDYVSWINTDVINEASKKKERWIVKKKTRISANCRHVIKRWLSLSKTTSNSP